MTGIASTVGLREGRPHLGNLNGYSIRMATYHKEGDAVIRVPLVCPYAVGFTAKTKGPPPSRSIPTDHEPEADLSETQVPRVVEPDDAAAFWEGRYAQGRLYGTEPTSVAIRLALCSGESGSPRFWRPDAGPGGMPCSTRARDLPSPGST